MQRRFKSVVARGRIPPFLVLGEAVLLHQGLLVAVQQEVLQLVHVLQLLLLRCRELRFAHVGPSVLHLRHRGM